MERRRLGVAKSLITTSSQIFRKVWEKSQNWLIVNKGMDNGLDTVLMVHSVYGIIMVGDLHLLQGLYGYNDYTIDKKSCQPIYHTYDLRFVTL